MTVRNVIPCLLALAALGFSSCTEDEDPIVMDEKQNIELNISGLEDLGSAHNYEGWIIVDGAAVSTGIFTVDADGNLSVTTFEVDKADADKATKFVVTIEPIPDADAGPSAVKILGGDFNGATSTLAVDDAAALGTSFEDATGTYILATPTDGAMDTNENSGVWWLDLTTGPGPGLDLPTLPDGWIYEGWAVIDGTPISTGTFSSASGVDDAAPFSSTSDGPAYPGEDLLFNAPAGITFPVDLAGKTVVVSVEPVPDNSTAPFLLKPLVGPVPTDATDHTSYTMNNNAVATNPTGTATK